MGKLCPLRKDLQKIFLEVRSACFSAKNVLYKCHNADSLKTESDASIKATICAIATEVKVRTEGPADTLRSSARVFQLQIPL